MCRCGVVTLGLPVRNETLCVDHENDLILKLHDDRFVFSLKEINPPWRWVVRSIRHSDAILSENLSEKYLRDKCVEEQMIERIN
jgi:hypothetical protein